MEYNTKNCLTSDKMQIPVAKEVRRKFGESAMNESNQFLILKSASVIIGSLAGVLVPYLRIDIGNTSWVLITEFTWVLIN